MIKIYKIDSENKEDFVDINTLLEVLCEAGLKYSVEDYAEPKKSAKKSAKKKAEPNEKIVPREGYFVTEDNVELPFGTLVAWVYLPLMSHISPLKYEREHTGLPNYEVFSTQKAAEHYIAMNS